MFAPHQLPFLIKYFDGIDLAVSRRLMRAAPPSETTLTDEFCALMSAANQRRERSLPYDIDALNTDLPSSGSLIEASFTVAVHQHSQRMEAYVSQADFGLVLEVQNWLNPAASWEVAYLMQAKRLFHGRSGVYDLGSSFSSTDKDQDRRVRLLMSLLGEDAAKYCLYAPPTSGYEANAVGSVRTLHDTNLSTLIFDFAQGLALRDHVQQFRGIEHGIWITDADASVKTARALHSLAFNGATPLTWFILDHPQRRLHNPSCSRSPFFDIDEDAVTRAAQAQQTLAIAKGDKAAIDALIGQLGDEARDPEFAAEGLKILPASTVTIRVQIGRPD